MARSRFGRAADPTGFTLVGTMVSFALVGIVALIFAEMMSNQFKAQRGLDVIDAVRDLKNQIQTLLSDANSCQASLSTLNPNVAYPPGTPVPQVTNTTGTILYKSGLIYEANRVLLVSMAVHDFIASPTNPLAGIATLTLNMNPVGQTFGAQTFRRDLQLSVTLTAVGNTISGCSAVGGLSDSLWQVVPSTIGTANQLIYYNSGNVGVGTSAPYTVFEAMSTIWNQRAISSTFIGSPYDGGSVLTRGARGTAASPAATQAGDSFGSFTGQAYDGTAWAAPNTTTGMYLSATENWSASGRGSQISWATTNNGTTDGTPKMTLSHNGNLSVNGSIKPGNGSLGTACTPEGALAYDLTRHVPLYCNSSAIWASSSALVYSAWGTTTAPAGPAFAILGTSVNTLLPSTPTTSSFTLPFAGIYDITASAATCVTGANSYTEAQIQFNGTLAVGEPNLADECGSGTAHLTVSAAAGNTVIIGCGNNGGSLTGCNYTVIKLP